MIKVYGIPNCNSVKKALDWLAKNKIKYEFHDYKRLGIDEAVLLKWINIVGWEILVNRKGTTWKQLDITTQSKITNAKTAIGLMIDKNSVIKRPVIDTGSNILVGFDEPVYEKTFS